MKVSGKVERVLQEEGISQQELEVMLRLSAIYTQTEGCNRRYHHWLFKVKNGEVTHKWCRK
jgi:hypothetical protein